MAQDVSFENDRGLTLEGLLDGERKRAAILCSHFTGFKEHKHLYKVAQELAENDLMALRFDFSDCIGGSEGTCEDMRLSHQVRDVFAAIDFLEDRGVENVGLMGHSLGGTTAIVAAANDQRVNAIVSAAALAKLKWDTLFKSKAEKWKEQGYITFDSWKEGEIQIKYGFYQDLKRYDASQLILATDAPTRVIQPGEDKLVDRKNADAIYENAPDPKDFALVGGADHMFSDEQHEKKLVDLTVDWFQQHL